MRKEVLLAISLGALIGLAVAFGVWRANKAFMPPTKTDAAQTSQINDNKGDNDQKTAQRTLVVTSPETGSIVSTDKTTIQGSATAGSTVTIVSNEDEKIVTAAKDGTFSGELSLTGGPNEIKVTAFDKDGNSATVTLVVVYSTEIQ